MKEVLQHRREPLSPQMQAGFMPGDAPLRARPFTMLERLLNYEDIPNYEAEVLAELYNPAESGSFRAFLRGKKYADLRFLLHSTGALPMLKAPEEIALLNFAPDSDRDGVWYLSHLASELRAGTASSSEEKRLIAPEHYRIEAFIGKRRLSGKEPDLSVTCDLRFRALDDGTRMVKFDLLPDLQVSRVAWNGKEIPFIQESRKQDGSFYLQMPEALAKGRTYEVTFEYSGGEILESAFPVPPRRVWYPTSSGPASRATYDLKFHFPRDMTIVTVGKLASQTREGAFNVYEWSSDVPIAQAVFRNLGDNYSKTTTEQTTHTELSAYVLGGPGTAAQIEAAPPGPNSSMGAIARYRPIRAALQPTSPGDVLIDAGNSVRVFNAWFGPPAYDSLSVVVGPGGLDSLPGLVYASPAVMGGYSALAARGAPGTMKTALDEAFAREVAGEWWGNTVGPASFHDEWLSGGFPNFSASLYDLAAKSGEFQDHWDKARQAILNPAGAFLSEGRPNDAGPIWMGVLNETKQTPGVDNIVNAAKGGFILHMLRSMMWEPKTNDDDFRAMMRDYIQQFANRTASTEDFKSVVDKHPKPVMDLDGNHGMDWFFNEWVYSTEIPSYRLEYLLASTAGGKTLLTGRLTQSGVSPRFAMPVPIFGEFGLKKVRVGTIPIRGNSTGEFKVVLPEMPKRVLLNLNHDVLTDREEVRLAK